MFDIWIYNLDKGTEIIFVIRVKEKKVKGKYMRMKMEAVQIDEISAPKLSS